MSRRRTGRSSRRDRYGIEETEAKIDETDNRNNTPYTLATDDGAVTPGAAAAAPRDPTPTSADQHKNEADGQQQQQQQPSSLWKLGRRKNNQGEDAAPDEEEPLSPQNNQEVFNDEPGNSQGGDDDDDDDDDESLEGYDMTLQELMYSTSSFYAIVVPGKWLIAENACSGENALPFHSLSLTFPFYFLQ